MNENIGNYVNIEDKGIKMAVLDGQNELINEDWRSN